MHYKIPFYVSLVIAALLSYGHADKTNSEVFGSSANKEKAALWYSRGNAIIYLSLVGISASSLSKQPEIGVPIYVASLIGQYSGLAVVGSNAESYCGEPSNQDCNSLGWTSYWISLASLGVFYFEMASLAIDDSRNKDVDGTKVLIGLSAGATSLVTYLYSWYSFYRIKSTADEKEADTLYGPVFEWDGKNSVIGMRMIKQF